MRIKSAFTMAEAILVMTILGIIATIMITTLKPAEYKDKALATLAKKVLSEIDSATTQILINDTAYGNAASLYIPGSLYIFSTATANNDDNLGKLYKKYLTAIRRPCVDTCPCSSFKNSFYLKDGACFGVTTGKPDANVTTTFPGETLGTEMQPEYGMIFFDTNGEDEPNIMGKDRFLLPLGLEGIQYATD